MKGIREDPPAEGDVFQLQTERLSGLVKRCLISVWVIVAVVSV